MRAFCALEGGKAKSHTCLHNPENIMAVAQTTLADGTILRWLAPLG